MPKQLTSPHELYANYRALNNKFATENTSWGELVVNQTQKPTIQVLQNLLKIAQILQDYRHRFFEDRPITITSGWRSEKYNKTISGASINSYHIKGLAIDFIVKGLTPQEVQARLDDIHIGGMEYAPTWTHIDLGNKRRFKP